MWHVTALAGATESRLDQLHHVRVRRWTWWAMEDKLLHVEEVPIDRPNSYDDRHSGSILLVTSEATLSVTAAVDEVW